MDIALGDSSIRGLEVEVALDGKGDGDTSRRVKLTNATAFKGDSRHGLELAAHGLIGRLVGGKFERAHHVETQSLIRAENRRFHIAVTVIRRDGSRGEKVACSWTGSEILDLPYPDLGSILRTMALAACHSSSAEWLNSVRAQSAG
jgi:hypothetical protein